MQLAKVLRVLIWLCVAHQALAGVAKGLNSTRLPNECSPKCSWTNPNIWDNGVAPNADDFVTMAVSGTYTIVIDTDIVIADFSIGFSDNKHGAQTFLVTNGSTFTSNGGFIALLSVQVQVDANSTMSIKLAGTLNGHFLLSGNAVFNGVANGASLTIDSEDIQLSLNYVTGQLQLNGGNLTVYSGVYVSLTSSITGNGYIIGNVDVGGDLEPGNSSNAIGTINIIGDLTFEDAGGITIEIAGDNSFDRVLVSGSVTEDGIATISPQGKYTPLAHQQFVAMNYSQQRNGFKEVKGSGFLGLIDNKWQAVVDQSYTAFLYDDASSVLISFALIASCAVFLVL